MLTQRMVLFWGHFDSIFKSSVRKKKSNTFLLEKILNPKLHLAN